MFSALEEADFIGLSPKITKAVIEFKEMVKGYTDMQEYLSVTELVEEILEKSGYTEMLKAEKSIESQSRLENIGRVLICYEKL